MPPLLQIGAVQFGSLALTLVLTLTLTLTLRLVVSGHLFMDYGVWKMEEGRKTLLRRKRRRLVVLTLRLC